MTQPSTKDGANVCSRASNLDDSRVAQPPI
jgi:hypothetical protein